MSGNNVVSGGSVANRSAPAAVSPAAPAPLIAPTGSPGVDSVLDVVNNTASPFMQMPSPEQGTAGAVAQGLGGVLSVVGAPAMIIDTAFAELTAPIAALFPAMPAMTLLGMHIGTPHAHLHPPSLIPPAPPVPLPSIGMLMGAGAITVLLGGIPAARAGDIGISITCGSLAPPFEVFTGSSNVFIGGARAARMLDITKHCNPTSMGPFAIAMGAAGAVAGAAGAIATGSVAAAAQTAANAAVLAIQLLCGKDPGIPPGIGALLGPPVSNVLIGGFPCPPIGQMACGALMKALKSVIKGLKGAPAKDSNGHCGEAGEPIYLVTGENFCSFIDFASSGLFAWRRHYTSARRSIDSPLGHGWRHFYQRALLVRLHKTIFTSWDGERIEFPRFERGANISRAGGRVLRRLARGHYQLSYRREPVMEFMGEEFAGELPLTRVFQDDRQLVLNYDRLGRLTTAIERTNSGTGQRRFELCYDEKSHIVEIIETTAAAEGSRAAINPTPRAAYVYAKSSDLDVALDALGGRWSYEYNGFHCLTRQTDPRDYSYTYRYDGWQRCTETRGQDGLWWAKAEYFPDNGFTRLIEGEGAIWEYYYERDGFICKVVDPYGGTRLRERDPSGQVTRDVDSGGREIRWLYDGDGANYGRVDRFGHLFPPALDMPKLPDPFARKLPSSSLEWQLGELNKRAVVMPSGMDGGLLAQVPIALAEQARNCFRAPLPQPVEAVLQVEHDAVGRKTREVDDHCRERKWQYDVTGNLVAERDRDGRVFTQQVTSWNLIGERRDPLGHAVRYEYSRLEQVIGFTDPLGNTSRYDYDLKKRLIRVHRHGKVREEYLYDSGDHFIEKRDSVGKVLFKNEIHDNHFVRIRHLSSGGFHRYDYDARGRIIEASTQDHDVRLQYDRLGQAVLDVRDGAGVEHSRSGQIWSTRLLGRFALTREVKPSYVELTDSLGQWTILENDAQGFVRRICGNNTTELLHYDSDGRLDARLTYRPDGHGWSTRYIYSPHGDLLQTEDSARGIFRYEVDAAHRLVAELAPGARHEFRLDAADNVMIKPGLNGAGIAKGNQLVVSATETFFYNDRDHLAERRQRDDSRLRYVYDSFDMLVGIENVSPRGAVTIVWEAAYDAMGRRLWSRQGDRKRNFYWDGDRLAAEVFPDGRFRVYQYACPTALTPLAFTEYANSEADPGSGRSYQVFSDPVGMPLCVENQRGEVVWWANHVDPYGLIAVRAGAMIEYNLRWPGHYYDPETGLHYNRYRYYEPSLGRYLQSDPIGHKGSPINLYAYCTNPLVQVDVLGLMASPHNHDSSKPTSPAPEGEEGEVQPPSHRSEPESSEATKLKEAENARDVLAATAEAKGKSAVVGAYDVKTGKVEAAYSDPPPPAESVPADLKKIAVAPIGESPSSDRNTVGSCAEFHAANKLIAQGSNPDDIRFTDAIRQRTGRPVPMCDNCKDMFPNGIPPGQQ